MKKFFWRVVGWTGTAMLMLAAALGGLQRVIDGAGVVWGRVKESGLYRSLNKPVGK